jgi:hypothetical protein
MRSSLHWPERQKEKKKKKKGANTAHIARCDAGDFARQAASPAMAHHKSGYFQYSLRRRRFRLDGTKRTRKKSDSRPLPANCHKKHKKGVFVASTV